MFFLELSLKDFFGLNSTDYLYVCTTTVFIYDLEYDGLSLKVYAKEFLIEHKAGVYVLRAGFE